jgi:DNA-binding HxlR family transcriptional regulator
MVLREVFLGNSRFEAMKQQLGAADNVLSKRLGWLVDGGLLTQRPYDDGGRSRLEYVLTVKGEDAMPVLNAVILWSEKHMEAPGDESHMRVIHHSCGLPASSADVCTHCGEKLTAATTSWHSPARSARPIALATAPATPAPAIPAPATPAPASSAPAGPNDPHGPAPREPRQ